MIKASDTKDQKNTSFINLHKNNTRLRVPKLGGVELKYVSFGDTKHFLKVLGDKEFNDKQFVQEILFNQLLQPKLTKKEFRQLPDGTLLRIARAFVQKEEHAFQYLQGTGDFFSDFRLALKTYEKKRLEQFTTTFKPLITDIQRSLTAFNRGYSDVIQQALDTSSYIKDSLKRVQIVAEQARQAQLEFIQPLKRMTEQYKLLADTVTNSLKPQIDLWNRWAEQNKSIFDSVRNFWKDFQKEYSIAEQKATRVLQKYKWFITPSLPLTFVFEVMKLDKSKGRQDAAVNQLFINYFSADQWRNLEVMVSAWKGKTLLKKRVNIFENCVLTLKNAHDKKGNPVLVILPTLITQIDGLLTDYLSSKGIQWDCEYDDFIQSGNVRKIGRKSQFSTNRSKTMTTRLDDLANDIFLNILFQRSQKGQPLKTPFNFNRHKIIHGENTSYGRRDYLIRAFLIIDFLAHLK